MGRPDTGLTLKDMGIVVAEAKTYARVPFGREMRKEFQFDPEWRNMNHGLLPDLYLMFTQASLVSQLAALCQPVYHLCYSYHSRAMRPVYL